MPNNELNPTDTALTAGAKAEKEKKPRADLTEGPIWSKLFIFALPILCMNLFQQLYNIADAAVVGIFVSSDALAAVGSTGAIINLTVCLFMGIASGAGVVVARFYGAKDDDAVRRSVHTSILTALISGALLTVLGIAITPLMLRLMRCPDEVFDMSSLYLTVVFGGMIPSMVYNIGAGILQAVGDSRRPLIYLVVSGVSNFFLDVLFIVPLGMGVGGAAIATVLSQLISAFLVVMRLMRVKENYRLDLRRLKLDPHMLSLVLRIGIPSGLQSMMYSFANLLIQSSINSFGTAAMAGCAAYSKIDGFVYMPLNAFDLAATTFTGQNIGAGKYERVHKGARAGVALSALITGSLGLAALFVSRPILNLLTQNNAEAVEIGMQMMYFLAPTYIIFSFTEVLSGVIRGAGTVTVTLIITAISICLLRVLLVAFVLPYLGDIRVVFAAYPISWAVCSTAFLIYYKFGHWMKKFEA